MNTEDHIPVLCRHPRLKPWSPYPLHAYMNTSRPPIWLRRCSLLSADWEWENRPKKLCWFSLVGILRLNCQSPRVCAGKVDESIGSNAILFTQLVGKIPEQSWRSPLYSPSWTREAHIQNHTLPPLSPAALFNSFLWNLKENSISAMPEVFIWDKRSWEKNRQ